ncbi:MAG TPA: restriction endonuclease subunit S [Polyangia bacterium]|nr:restriction endonuclease subunit S [Polyangia bacterium]
MLTEKWKTKSLGDVATLQRGFDLPYRLRKPGLIPVVTSSGTEDRHSEAKVRGPGVVTGRYGTIGEVFFVPNDFWPLNTTLYVRNFHGNHPLFVSYLLRTIDFETHSGKSGVPGVNRNDLHELDVVVPPTRIEQEAIARALSDADALIESLEQLLAKKRHLKQGAMQELLTGKKRLPGFSGKWKTTRLGEICEIAMGRTPPRLNPAFWGQGHVWLSIADLRGKVVAASKEEITALAAAGMQVIPKNTLLMSFKLSIGRLCFAGCDLYTNEAICSFSRLRADADFLYYVLSRTDFSLYGKQAVKGYTLNKESLGLVEVRLPSDTEQTAIAAVLSDMDADIAALESKLAKTRQVKQGMMQELLTGRIRLV